MTPDAGRRALLCALACTTCSAFAGAPASAIRGASYVDPSGAIVPECTIVIQEGRIAQVGGEPPAGAEITEYAGCVVCPGFVDVCAALSAADQTGEASSALQPEANAEDVLNRFSPQLEAALASGVTTFALCPDDSNLVGGRVAVVQTGDADGRPQVRTRDGPMKLSLSPAIFSAVREPSARAGALAMLREALSHPPAEAADPWARFAAGQLPGLMSAPSAADVRSALDLAAQFKLRLAIVHSESARDVAAAVGAAQCPVVVGPLTVSSATRVLQAAGVFERAGVPVAIAGGLPGRAADSLRQGAALAVRYGMSDSAARRAITRVPAELLGVGEEVGSIAVGRRADLLVFTGDPLDPRSRLVAVVVDGVVVRSMRP